MRILVATGNKGKLEEFSRILTPMGFQVTMPKELGVEFDVEETGETFAENSKIKAEALYKQTGIPTIADDSGLCIDALGGRPGVKTARYGGDDADYAEKFRLMFEELEGIEDRTAAFVCSICFFIDDENIIQVEEKCNGKIGFEPKGDLGFGFDPIFYVGERSFAELSADEKDAISHRGKALRKFSELLNDYLANKGENK